MSPADDAVRAGGARVWPDRQATGAIIPRATYRLQLHRNFDFDAARTVLPYLQRLGISHVYCSPIATAQPGSLHGYDVIDPIRINPELGGREGFERFALAARALGLGLLLDQVPNHMGIAGGHNAWWVDVLENGQASPCAHCFDIEWHGANPALQDKVMAPVLSAPYGDVLDRGGIVLVFDAARGSFAFECDSHRFPLDPRTYGAILQTAAPRELQSLAHAFEDLPPHHTADPAARARRRELQRELQRRLARVATDDPAIAAAVTARVEHVNSPAQRDLLDTLLEAQAYLLAYWRSAVDDINYRRFFDVDDLAALRIEDERVFEVTQALALDLAEAGWIDGLRIDHPDGLLDPAQYFARLQRGYARRRGLTSEAGEARPLYVVVEKIEAAHERVPMGWAVHGTTGYRFAAAVSGLFVERRHARRMDRVWRSYCGVPSGAQGDGERIVRDAKRLIARGTLGAMLTELAQLLRRIALADRHTRDHGYNRLRDALAEVAAAMPVYRTYVQRSGPPAQQDRRCVDGAVARALKQSHVADAALYEFVRRSLLGESMPQAPPELAEQVRGFAMRFQQFSAPVAARGVEDTAFYRYLRLVSLNEVGGDPLTFGVTAAAFHAANKRCARDWPHAMLATSTHDNKRSEDVRNRISVLAERPAEWKRALRRWRTATRAWRRRVDGVEAPTAAEQFLLLQTLLGTLPSEGLTEESLPAYRDRIVQYMQKAAREAKQQTTWADPNPVHEAPLVALVRGVLARVADNAVLGDLQAQAAALAWYGALNSLSMTLLKYTAPGVPDLYQGTELIDLSLVDPDNRRPVDHALRARLLAQLEALVTTGDLCGELAKLASTPTDGRLKLWLIWRLLTLRRLHARFFATASYAPLRVVGERRRHVIAFARRGIGATLIVVASRKFAGLPSDVGQTPLGEGVWADTAVERPAWLGASTVAENILTGTPLSLDTRVLALAGVFRAVPLAAIWAQEVPDASTSTG